MAKTVNRAPTARQGTGSVRIISGQWRGRKLPVCDLEGLRPTTDRIKETIFNWLAPYVREARCLDLFAGSGALGLEALSRYAAQVTLVEQSPIAAKQLRQNLAALGSPLGKVVETDALKWLAGAAMPFDLVFLDPPFRRDLLRDACVRLEEGGWLSAEALIYLEFEREGEAPQLPQNWNLIKDKATGQVRYQLYQREVMA